MARGVAKCSTGLSNHSKNPNRRNTLQSHVQHRSSHPHQDRTHQPQEGVPQSHEVREQASQRMAKYQQKMAEYYNQRVKFKRFEDLVLQKVTPTTKDPAQGKLGPTQERPYRVIHYSRRGSYHLEDLDGNKSPRPWNVEHLKRYYKQGLQLIHKLLKMSYDFSSKLIKRTIQCLTCSINFSPITQSSPRLNANHLTKRGR